MSVDIPVDSSRRNALSQACCKPHVLQATVPFCRLSLCRLQVHCVGLCWSSAISNSRRLPDSCVFLVTDALVPFACGMRGAKQLLRVVHGGTAKVLPCVCRLHAVLVPCYAYVCGDVGREVIQLTHFQGQSPGQGPYLLTPYQSPAATRRKGPRNLLASGIESCT
jgi:hypothetical protein